MPRRSPLTPSTKTDAELRQLAVEYIENKIFTSFDLPQEDAQAFQLAFMVFALMTCEQLHRFMKKDCGLIYEYMTLALPRQVNGRPCFLSAHILTKKDAHRFRELVTHLQQHSVNFMKEGPK